MKLNACPFCACPADSIDWQPRGVKVGCFNKDCRVRPYIIDKPRRAAELWNTRPQGVVATLLTNALGKPSPLNPE